MSAHTQRSTSNPRVISVLLYPSNARAAPRLDQAGYHRARRPRRHAPALPFWRTQRARRARVSLLGARPRQEALVRHDHLHFDSHHRRCLGRNSERASAAAAAAAGAAGRCLALLMLCCERSCTAMRPRGSCGRPPGPGHPTRMHTQSPHIWGRNVCHPQPRAHSARTEQGF
jgi:hypothetical protein